MKKEKWTLEKLNRLILENDIKDEILWDKIDKNINCRSYIHFKCRIHKNEYKVRIDHVFGNHKRGCPLCGNNCWSEYKINKYIQPKLKSMNMEIISDISHGINVNSNVKIKCNECGNIIETKIVWLKNKRFSCSNCKLSSMEKELINLLNTYNIKFETQKKFKDLIGVNGGDLSYDFYIPSKNLLIECQGQQHYEPFGFDKNRDKLNKQIEHDNRKRKYAQQNNISLIEIKYNENIKNIMEKLL